MVVMGNSLGSNFSEVFVFLGFLIDLVYSLQERRCILVFCVLLFVSPAKEKFNEKISFFCFLSYLCLLDLLQFCTWFIALYLTLQQSRMRKQRLALVGYCDRMQQVK